MNVNNIYIIYKRYMRFDDIVKDDKPLYKSKSANVVPHKSKFLIC